MKNPRTIKTLPCALVFSGLMAVLAGCQEWMAAPVRVEQNFGQSARLAMLQQVYDIDRARNPDAYPPDGTIDGMKSVATLQRGYQSDIGNPQRVRQPSTFNSMGSISQQGGGGQ